MKSQLDWVNSDPVLERLKQIKANIESGRISHAAQELDSLIDFLEEDYVFAICNGSYTRTSDLKGGYTYTEFGERAFRWKCSCGEVHVSTLF